jgi:calcineurin-like phosphoesterase family protein
MIWFTADTHLNDFAYSLPGTESDEIKYETRTTTNLIIKNWNNLIQKDDYVYVLGDFGYFKDKKEVEDMLSCLNGKKYLVIGNNDGARVCDARGWKSVSMLKKIDVRYTDGGERRSQEIVLCHYPMLVWQNSGSGSWNLHGHSHNTLPEDFNSYRYDVGVNGQNFKPISFFQVQEIMKDKYFIPKDYHGHRVVTTVFESSILERKNIVSK